MIAKLPVSLLLFEGLGKGLRKRETVGSRSSAVELPVLLELLAAVMRIPVLMTKTQSQNTA